MPQYFESVLVWLKSVSSDSAYSPRTGKKRKKTLLPARSESAESASSKGNLPSSKRRKLQDIDTDDENVNEYLPSREPTFTDTSRASSGDPSPYDQLARLQIAAQPVLIKNFADCSKVPTELGTILETIKKRFSRGTEVISEAYKASSVRSST
jgi:hypothetical protein